MRPIARFRLRFISVLAAAVGMIAGVVAFLREESHSHNLNETPRISQTKLLKSTATAAAEPAAGPSATAEA